MTLCTVHPARALLAFSLVLALRCAAPSPVTVAPEPAPVVRETPRVCTLESVGQTFLCDMDFGAPDGASCEASVNDGVRAEFLARMTGVSLQLLYLDGEPGAQGPHRHNDPARVFERVGVSDCSRGPELCRCRLSYQDLELLQIFYDSAGCRRSSRLASHPLYFRGVGC
jgi:hypothetical protein